MSSQSVVSRPAILLALPTYLASWVSKRARADVQRRLAAYDLSTPDFGVIAALSDGGALSQQQLADGLGADKSHIVRLVDQLEARRLVQRSADPGDRRRHRVEVTPAGRALYRKTRQVIEQVEAEHLRVLTASERRTLTRLLQRVLRAQDDGPAS